MQNGLVPELPPSGGYEKIVTAMDVFFRYLFAYLTSNQDAKTIAKVIFTILTKHAYLPTTISFDSRSGYVSHVIKEVVGVHGITSQHATTKHAQQLPERLHASFNHVLKIKTGERRSLWQNYVSIALLNYNTFYHASIGCESSRLFHGGIHYVVLYLKKGIRWQKTPTPKSQIAHGNLEQTQMIFQDVRKNTMQVSIKYRAKFDKKATASKPKKAEYV